MDAVSLGREIAVRVAGGETHQEISVSLQNSHPSKRGLSARSIRRRCSEEGVHYRSGLQSDGLWQQVRVDHGTEFALVLTVQQHLGHLRLWQDRAPALQSTSRQNHRVERIWPEINQRINYPVKRVLIEMEGNDEINMADDIVKYCVSWTTIKVMGPAIQKFVAAWNAHRIPGISGGIPNVLASCAPQTRQLPTVAVPSTAELIRQHHRQGGTLKEEHVFGEDPLQGYPQLQQLRERDFHLRFPTLEEVFQNILHSDGSQFKATVHHFISLTSSFARLLPLH